MGRLWASRVIRDPDQGSQTSCMQHRRTTASRLNPTNLARIVGLNWRRATDWQRDTRTRPHHRV